ncbi:MAG: PAS domain-containing protein [Candidatus Eisenbacteria bacterium]|uniref:histidine kinase n=1 Tax=Eiseniibacteriota bacterium TaxID=2212470 RepID=A0A849SRX5_UNCEI|nr:PAS domain-containing protein [Candidatus Eisenbacteria bacterium]
MPGWLRSRGFSLALAAAALIATPFSRTAALVMLALAAAHLALAGAERQSRLRSLGESARRMGEGDREARALELPGDAIGRLGTTLNRMAELSRARLADLELERDQRERVLSHVSDGVALLDSAGRVLHANQSLADIFGLALPPARGTRLQDVLRLSDIDAVIETSRREGRTIERELRFWTPAERVVRVTATPLEGAADRALLLVLQDHTEAERVDRVRRDFVANVSHELKTPLTSLRGYAETLLDGGLDDLEHREGFVRVIRDQAERLQALVEDLLALSELERPDARLRLERFDLRPLVERAMAMLRERAERKQLEFVLVPGAPVPLRADRGRIEQVVANLLDNAIKYTERGAVTVALGGDEAHAWCEVRDTGAGIPPDDLSRVFERFYRVDKSRVRDVGGTGLGLSIVKHILTLHEGDIEVESAPGRGSRFRFELPREGSGPSES